MVHQGNFKLTHEIDHYYKNHFHRQSNWVFGGGFCIHLRAGASVNRTLMEVVLCPPPLIEKNKKKLETLDEPAEPIMGPPNLSRGGGADPLR